MPARDCHDARASAVLEAGNLRRASKAGANNSNTDNFIVRQFDSSSLR
jgi:hypothetical protein